MFARPCSMLDFLAAGIAVALLITFFVETSRGEVVVVSKRRIEAASATSNKTWTDKNGIPHYSIPVNDTGAAASSPSASGTTRGRVDSGSPQAAAPTSSAAAAGSAARYARPRARSAAPAAANCDNGQCGTMQRRGVFGLRRGTQPRGVIHW